MDFIYLQVVLYKHVNVDFTCGKRSLGVFALDALTWYEKMWYSFANLVQMTFSKELKSSAMESVCSVFIFSNFAYLCLCISFKSLYSSKLAGQC